jgi:hypothetical protein
MEIKQLGIDETALAASLTTTWVFNEKYTTMRVCWLTTAASGTFVANYSFDGEGTDVSTSESISATTGYIDYDIAGKFVQLDYSLVAYPNDLKVQVFFLKELKDGGGGGSSTDSSVYFVQSALESAGNTDFYGHTAGYTTMPSVATISGANGCTLTEVLVFSEGATSTKGFEVIDSSDGTTYNTAYTFACSGLNFITSISSLSVAIPADKLIAVRGSGTGSAPASYRYDITLRLQYN